MTTSLDRILDALPPPEPTPPDGLPLGNRMDVFEELVYITLTLMTRSQTSITAAWDGLMELTGGRLEDLDRCDQQELELALRPVGFARKRSQQLSEIAALVRPLDSWVEELRTLPTEDVLERLERLPGVGPKTAKCVAMYSLERSVLPVDIHVLRVAKRLGLVASDATWSSADKLLEASVPDALKHDVHVQFVVHGRAICTSSRPGCERCPLDQLCPSAGTIGEPRRAIGG